jgi:nifR3 family TIM-barrel protein
MRATQIAFNIKDIPIRGDLVLAPMDGISDLPFRSICTEFGSAISYTGFLNARDINQNLDTVRQAAMYSPEERPIAFQIYGDSEAELLQASSQLLPLQPDMIDINMGCPDRRVTARGAGAGLLKDPQKVGGIVRGMVDQLPIPVTVKIRLGWDERSQNYLDLARIIEDNGAALLAVHARTRAQRYQEPADWKAIAEIVKAVKIPVIGNGDVQTPADIDLMKSETGCAGVMIGRAAIGNPWIFQRLNTHVIPPDTRRDVILDHLARSTHHYGTRMGIRLFRKHLKRYLRPVHPDPDVQYQMLTCDDYHELSEWINGFFSSEHAQVSPAANVANHSI